MSHTDASQCPERSDYGGHYKRPTKLCLCVDDFGVKYCSDDDANNLCNAISANFKHTTDKEGRYYCGLTIDWNYALEHVDVSMPNYVQEAQKKLNYHQKVFPHHSLHKNLPIKYGVKGSQQLHAEPKKDHLLQTNKIKPMQFIVGTHQHDARAIDNTMLASLN